MSMIGKEQGALTPSESDAARAGAAGAGSAPAQGPDPGGQAPAAPGSASGDATGGLSALDIVLARLSVLVLLAAIAFVIGATLAT